jgi:hypothetical protein
MDMQFMLTLEIFRSPLLSMVNLFASQLSLFICTSEKPDQRENVLPFAIYNNEGVLDAHFASHRKFIAMNWSPSGCLKFNSYD